MSLKMTRLRRAETNKSMLIVLGVVAVLALGFWGYRMMTSEAPPPVTATGEPVTYYCYECKKTFEVPADQVSGMKPSAEGNYQCSICKKMTAKPGFGPSSRMPQP